MTTTRTRILSVALAASAVFGVTSTSAFAADVNLKSATPIAQDGLYQLGGNDRYETAAQISASTFDGPVDVVYLATGTNFPDALAAGPAAAKLGAPLLLTASTLPQATADELKRLSPKKVILLGQASAVSTQAEDAVKALGFTTERLGGNDRYETAALVTAQVFSGYTGKVYVASGTNFPDALSGGSVAAMDGAPVLLVNPASAPQATIDLAKSFNATQYIALGGQNAVSDAALGQLQAAKPAAQGTTRIQGQDRFETAAKTSASRTEVGATVFLATGTNFPDALAGVAVAGVNHAPILLVSKEYGKSCLPQATADEFDRINPSKVVILGSSAAVDNDVVSYLC